MKEWFIKNRITDEEFIAVCKASESMAKAAATLGVHFNSFKKRAIELECYVTNQSGKGNKKNMPKVDLNEIIFENKQPQYQTYKLKLRLFEEGYKQNKCEKCGVCDWNGEQLNMELDHIDGDKTNHHLDNLRILCPNCHSQTPTFRNKKR